MLKTFDLLILISLSEIDKLVYRYYFSKTHERSSFFQKNFLGRNISIIMNVEPQFSVEKPRLNIPYNMCLAPFTKKLKSLGNSAI